MGFAMDGHVVYVYIAIHGDVCSVCIHRIYIYILDMNINDIWTDTNKLTKVHILCR